MMYFEYGTLMLESDRVGARWTVPGADGRLRVIRRAARGVLRVALEWPFA
jgi:hypothetical protein